MPLIKIYLGMMIADQVGAPIWAKNIADTTVHIYFARL
jgi:dTDP-4-dehydrorhamnose reductase